MQAPPQIFCLGLGMSHDNSARALPPAASTVLSPARLPGSQRALAIAQTASAGTLYSLEGSPSPKRTLSWAMTA